MLYKYRTIENFKYFIDIILKKRLYAASYFDMNDPMEGYYVYNMGSPDRIIHTIKGEKKKIRIVSLSRKYDNPLMWAHYANGHRGVVIGVEINRNKYDVRNVNYSNHMFKLENSERIPTKEIAKRILTEKYHVWSYEEEERIFVEDGQQYADVKVKEVILGSKMSNQDKGFIRELINKVDTEINVKQVHNYNQLSLVVT